MDIKFKAITFIIGNDILNGYYFYNMTLPEALIQMKEKKIEVINNFKMNIAVYPY
jgi:hypothetical protein